MVRLYSSLCHAKHLSFSFGSVLWCASYSCCFVLVAYTGAGVVYVLGVLSYGSFYGATVGAERISTGEFPQLIRHSLSP
jgi:hypothetical protein